MLQIKFSLLWKWEKIVVCSYSWHHQKATRGNMKMWSYEQLPFIYRLNLYVLFINGENETALYRQGFVIYSKTCLNWTPMGLKNLFCLDRFKLYRQLVDGTVKSDWFRQVFGLLRVRFRQVSLYRCSLRQVWLYTYKKSLKILKEVTRRCKWKNNRKCSGQNK